MTPSPSQTPLPQIAPWILGGFTWYARRYLRERFHAVRILRSGAMPMVEERPMVVYFNHASWWDPLVALLLARTFQPARASFAPMEATMLKRYRFFRKLGCFGVERGRLGSSRDFLLTAKRILAERNALLWITPQGRFEDVRTRPVRLEEGIGVLASRHPDVAFVPMAVEYVFWSEPRPEILVSFGQPILPKDRSIPSRKLWTQHFAEMLGAEQERLAHASLRREAGEWETMHRGKAGIQFIYDIWRRLGSFIRRQKYVPGHMEERKP